MRKLKIIEHISMDGIIQSSDEDNFPYGNWTMSYRSPEGLGKILALSGEKFDLLLGRMTYDIWSEYWPKAPASPMADRLNAATKYVVTHRPESLEWGPVVGISSDIVKSIRELKSQDGLDLIVWGSSKITSTIIENGLADEMTLIVYPVLLGSGKRLFAEGTPARAFKLVSTDTTSAGVLMNSYKFVGAL